MAQDSEHLTELLLKSSSIHIIGCGLNKERPANKAIYDLEHNGWRLIPIHVKDSGATVNKRPIRPVIDEGIFPEVIVLFLAPERALEFVKQLIFKFPKDDFPLIWFQHGAKHDDAVSMLEDYGTGFVIDDCIVKYILRNKLSKAPSNQSLPWYRQTKDRDAAGCSIWEVFDGNTEVDQQNGDLEWVGDILDLEYSKHIIPRYIRSMLKQSETLHELALRLS